MAGPLSGIGSGQQIPLATTYKPGQSNNTQLRPDDTDIQPKQDTVQAQGSPIAEAFESGTDSQNLLTAQRDEALQGSSGSERGSLIDIKV